MSGYIEKRKHEKSTIQFKNCGSKKCVQLNPQPVCCFNKKEKSIDGYQVLCRDCFKTIHLIKTEPLRKAKKEKELLAVKPTAKSCTNKNCSQANPQILSSFYNRGDYPSRPMSICKTCSQLKSIKYRSDNLEKCNKIGRDWRKNNIEKARQHERNYVKRNPACKNSIKAKRKASKLQRTPKWLTEQHFNEIKEIYVLAKDLQWLSDPNDRLEVDHIVPLQGKNVSGLHVPWNLQILPRSLNATKSNKFEGIK